MYFNYIQLWERDGEEEECERERDGEKKECERDGGEEDRLREMERWEVGDERMSRKDA